MKTATTLALLCATATLLEAGPLGAQAAQTADTSAQRGSEPPIFAPLTLAPAPSARRLATGAPGPKYWQNRADYDLHATLDTATGTLQGSMTLRYTNHSPDTLPFLWFQTEQNAFRDTTDTASQKSPYGDIIDQFTEVVDGKPTAVHLEEQRTETKVTLPRPLRPGETATLNVAWHFVVPPRKPFSTSDLANSLLSMRMGREESLYQIAQWYPRVNVYDDVKGWNTEPYNGYGEFFLEYGNFTLAVTVPSDYIVAATGTLENPRDVLTAPEITRLAQAARSDTTIHIITAAELTNGTAHRKHDGMVTWRFHATNVRDAVFSASPEYLWDATSWHGILAQAYYRPSAAKAWREAADMARTSVQEYSVQWFQYPYPQISVAEGNVSGGMEYPMISFDGSVSQGSETYALLTHEVGHNWFPMIVGSNERVYSWMDEGFNSFINTFALARRYPTARGNQATWIDHEVYKGGEEPIVGGEYAGPPYLLQLLRQDILGPDVFDKAFRAYIQRWAFKHPTPVDFFRTMDDVSGHKLDWFWRECFLEAPRFDQAIDAVRQTVQGTDTHVTVTYGNKGRVVMPLLVHFTFSDSTTQDMTYPAEVWEANPTSYTVSYTFPKKTVSRIVLDPATHLPDADLSNNTWTAK